MSPPTATSRTSQSAALPPLARRLRRLGVSGRRMRRMWSRERLGDALRTLAYVVPLTLLIWVWAQDQQIDTQPRQSVPIAIAHADGQKLVSVLRAGNGDSVAFQQGSGGQRVLTTVTLQGPRIGLNSMLRALDDPRGPVFEVTVQSPVIDQTTIPLRTYLNNSPLLQELGVSVTDVAPSDLVVRVEDRVQAQARLVPGGGVAADDLAGPALFDPPTVEVSGPASAIAALGRAGEVTLPVELPADLPPGEHAVTAEVRLPAGASPQLQVTPVSVAARFTRREQRQERYTIPAVPVFARVPAAMNNVVVVVEPPVVTNIVVEGPSDVIARIRSDQLRDEVAALLPITREDEAAGDGRRAVRISLPEGVRVVGELPQVGFTIRRIAP